MILRTSPPSPFGRKVKLTAKILNIYDKLEIHPADTSDPKDNVRQQNPLGKIPVMILEDGREIYDSRVICEYLNHRFDGTLFPDGAEKFQTLTLQALADGMTDAAVLQVYENRFRPEEKRSEEWRSYQKEKVERSLHALSKNPPLLNDNIYIGHISLACALGYLDFRFEGQWRDDHKPLVEWLNQFSDKVPGFNQTAPTA